MNYYTYLIASLPMLQFGAETPFSFENLIKKCEGLIPEADIEILKLSDRTGEYPPEDITQPTLEMWRGFDTALRNELAITRAAHKKIDANPYLRKSGYFDFSLRHVAQAAHRSQSILEAEKVLDAARWEFLDRLAFGHYFDLDYLVVYAHKLLILERWDRIRRSDKDKLVGDVLMKEEAADAGA